jgi:hypothetical protein
MDCTGYFDPNTDIALNAVPAEYSIFCTWSGICSGTNNGCTFKMNSDLVATATFDKDTGHSVKIDGVSQTYYPSIMDAYAHASTSNIIKSWGTDFTENLLLGKSIDVTIKGGFDAGYITNTGNSTLHGTLAVGKGSLTLENLVVQ